MTHSFKNADMTAMTARAVDVAAQYFAYVAGVGVAAAIAVVTMVYSAQTALTWVDAAAFPERRPAQARPVQSPLPAQPDKVDASAGTFAMLPSAMPLKMRNDVLSSNF